MQGWFTFRAFSVSVLHVTEWLSMTIVPPRKGRFLRCKRRELMRWMLVEVLKEIPWFPGRGRNSWQLAAWTGACEEFLTEAGGTPEVSRSQKGMIYVYIHITLQRQKTLYKYLRYIDAQERFSLHGAWVPYLPQLRRFNEVDDSTQAQELPSRLRCSRANEITNGTNELRETDDASETSVHGLHPDGNTFERLITCNIEAGLISNLQDCTPLWIRLVLVWKVARSGWSCRDDQWHKAECEHARSMQLTPTDAA